MGVELEGQRIGVLLGGLSGEREVSLRSGENVYRTLRKRGYEAMKLELSAADQLIPQLSEVELVFICLHGGIGEDGTIQALLDLLAKPYTGSPALACRMALDKLLAKEAFAAAGLPTPAYVHPQGTRWLEEAIEGANSLGYPLVVKPRAEGSSLGVKIVRREGELEPALRETREKFGDLYLERFIPGKEVTAGILRLDREDRPLPLIELRPKEEFYDYRAKYTPGATEFVIPAEVPDRVGAEVQELALAAHRALGCFGFSRVDLRVTADGEVYILEVNTIPGMTATSDLPKAAQAAGISFEELVEFMLKTAVAKEEEDAPDIS
ncbi:MAG: D-alanine--D-alanine ligase [Candidatus Acetothermia bacterium]|jgi:D-alanine-D-alanine ligase|nr:D-alanine--D-alanine ligase [Candidatus Acetothermia bacterium]MDH7505063.1 D-alanine--D-alanine ligase [Candidatus Acetothermia bacterium]